MDFKELSLKECEKLSLDELQDYAYDYMMHSHNYSHELQNLIELKELKEDAKPSGIKIWKKQKKQKSRI